MIVMHIFLNKQTGQEKVGLLEGSHENITPEVLLMAEILNEYFSTRCLPGKILVNFQCQRISWNGEYQFRTTNCNPKNGGVTDRSVLGLILCFFLNIYQWFGCWYNKQGVEVYGLYKNV